MKALAAIAYLRISSFTLSVSRHFIWISCRAGIPQGPAHRGKHLSQMMLSYISHHPVLKEDIVQSVLKSLALGDRDQRALSRLLKPVPLPLPPSCASEKERQQSPVPQCCSEAWFHKVLLQSLRKGTRAVQLLQCQTHRQRWAPAASPETPMCKSRGDENPRQVTLLQPHHSSSVFPHSSEKASHFQALHNYWAAPFLRLSAGSICSSGPNSGCVARDFLCPRRVWAFNISSSRSYTGTTFLHFMLRRCSIPLLLCRRTENNSAVWFQQCREEKHTHGFNRVPF